MPINPLQLPAPIQAQPIDFSFLSAIPDAYKQAQFNNDVKALAQASGGQPSLADLGKLYLKHGRVDEFKGLAQLAQQQEMQKSNILHQRTQEGFQGRQVSLAEQSAAEQNKGFETREIDDGAGGKTLVRINKQTGETSRVPITGAPGAPVNPFAYGKQNEGQSKDSGYANRMFRAEGVLRDPEVESAATNLWETAKGKLPGFVANYATSPAFQKFDQAKRDFVNAVLRRESGAAISQSEFDNANKQYFPQPGESAEKIAEKRRNRQDAIAGVAGGGGPHYKPPMTFGPGGELVPTGNSMQGATPQGAVTASAPAPAAGGITKAEYDALPSGATYTAPDGSVRTKR